MARMVRWLLALSDTTPGTEVVPGYWWNGRGEMTVTVPSLGGPITYMGNVQDKGPLIEIGDVPFTAELPDRRASFKLALTGESARAAWNADLGAVQVQMNWIWSRDNGRNWTLLPMEFVGRLSNYQIKDGELAGEVETYLGNIDRGRPLMWSHEAQQRRGAEITVLRGAPGATVGDALAAPGFTTSIGALEEYDELVGEIWNPTSKKRVSWRSAPPTAVPFDVYAQQQIFRETGESAPSPNGWVLNEAKTSATMTERAAGDVLAYLAGVKLDLAFEQAREVAEETDVRWPPFD